ncbi:dioxygenase [Xylariaceae sp. FL0255]|nr:dioxygenase [Xylariaceae sp. FL0255]
MASNNTTKTPALLDLTIDNITPNAIRINSQGDDKRLTYLMSRLITHLHDFARETRLSTDEWMAAIKFLVGCGQISNEVRQEFILLSDVLGLSLLVDSINHPKPPHSTEGSVLGPFHTHDAPTLAHGSNMSSDTNGEPLLCICTVKDTNGKPIAGVKIDIWETDSTGNCEYHSQIRLENDVQHENRQEPSERCIMESDAEGRFWFKGIRPVSYPIPHDGPVGKLLVKLNRHCWRPAHLHFMFEKEGWDHLITSLYMKGDHYETTDAVFGVKQSLIVDPAKIDEATAKEYGMAEGDWILKHDFVLTSQEETDNLRDSNAVEALGKLGLKMTLVDHLPIPDVD